MSIWDNVTGVENAESNYIGKRFAYARKESKKGIRYDFLIPILNEAGLDNYAPNPPTPADAFRRACQDIPKRYVHDKESGRKYKINMILIDESADPIIRNLQLTEIDKQNRTSTDGKLVAQIKFFRDSEAIVAYHGYQAGYEFDTCPDFVCDRIQAAIERFRKERDLVSEMQIHNIIQKILQDAGNPVNRILSTWNIPVTREELLDRLLRVAERLNEYEEGIFVTDTLPVIRTPEVTSKVKADAVIYAVDKLNSLYKKAKDDISVSTDVEKTTLRVKGQLKQEAEKVMSLVEEYESILGEAMDEVRQAREITESKLKEFADSPEQQMRHRETKRRLRSGGNKPAAVEAISEEVEKPVRRIKGMQAQAQVQASLAM